MATRTRREFFGIATRTASYLSAGYAWAAGPTPYEMVATVDRGRILATADKYLSEQPLTVTAARCERSAGVRHDYYSEPDYWWPEPRDPNGPDIQRDHLSTPNHFTE